jgi:hypothetical protein
MDVAVQHYRLPKVAENRGSGHVVLGLLLKNR